MSASPPDLAVTRASRAWLVALLVVLGGAQLSFALAASEIGVDGGYYLDVAMHVRDGHGLVSGDMIKVGSNAPARVKSVDYTSQTVTVDKALSWSAGDGVSYPYSGAAPDMGGYEN